MKRTLLVPCTLAVLAILALAACGQKTPEPPASSNAGEAPAAPPAAPSAAAREQEAREIAVDAYIFGYPLVTMEMTRRVLTNVVAPTGRQAPMGQFVRLREYPTAAFREVPAANADTLYTAAWFDVSREPWIVSQPEMKDRYFLMPMLDGWTTVFAAPGTRTTGGGAQKYAITGPGWSGKLPPGVSEYKSPTAIVWLLGRIYSSGTPDDYKAVHALQDRFTAVPLRGYGERYAVTAGRVDPDVDDKLAVRSQVDQLDAVAYFKLLAELMVTNPPTAEDAAVVARMANIGLLPGHAFATDKLDPAVLKGLADAPTIAREKIAGWMTAAVEAGDSRNENGWRVTTRTGIYGTDYLQRAFIATIGLGANRPQDEVYTTSVADAEGRPYSGSNDYRLHFEKGQMPPVNAFWSLTLYDSDFFFVDNELERYALGSHSRLRTNQDGSVDIYLQRESPGGDREANWLPAPDGEFILMLRLYWPREKDPSILDGSWKIPPVTLVP
ncbi:MAG: DUF1254 domain-containing protein [Candidatus Accumulibacter sp.]|nr:DUF1254 domain-containing protein [Accumulibacter sp.]